MSAPLWLRVTLAVILSLTSGFWFGAIWESYRSEYRSLLAQWQLRDAFNARRAEIARAHARCDDAAIGFGQSILEYRGETASD